MRPRHTIQHRLVLYVSLCLLALSLLSSGVSYRISFDRELNNAITLERQLVKTVQAQAEVAVYASNTAIAEGVIEGLLANPGILAVQIVGKSSRHFQVGATPENTGYVTSVTEYPLFSPVDGTERIGSISIFRNETMIRTDATSNAQHQTVLLLLHVLVTALLIILFPAIWSASRSPNWPRRWPRSSRAAASGCMSRPGTPIPKSVHWPTAPTP